MLFLYKVCTLSLTVFTKLNFFGKAFVQPNRNPKLKFMEPNRNKNLEFFGTEPKLKPLKNLNPN